MTIGSLSICGACARLGPRVDRPGVACAAFPDGIPDEIYVDGFDHRKPFDGDNGLRFELAAGEESYLAAYDEAHAG